MRAGSRCGLSAAWRPAPEVQAEFAQDVSVAFMLALERLPPLERAAFLPDSHSVPPRTGHSLSRRWVLTAFVPKEDRQIRRRWLHRNLIQHSGDMPAVVRRVVNRMQDYVLAAHRASPSTDESEMHYLVAHFGRQRIGVTHIPRINLALRFAQLPERWRGFWIAGGKVMGHAL
jgi:hypothetical protein